MVRGLFDWLQQVFQIKLLHFVQKLYLGDETGVGGGIFTALLAVDELLDLSKAGMDLVGIGVAEYGIEVHVVAGPDVQGLLGEPPGLLPVAGLRLDLRLDQTVGEAGGKVPEIAGVQQGSGKQDGHDPHGEPQALHPFPTSLGTK